MFIGGFKYIPGLLQSANQMGGHPNASMRTAFLKSFIKCSLTRLQCTRLIELLKTFDVAALYLKDKEKAYSLMTDLIIWVQNNEKKLANLSSIDDVKSIFLNESAGKSVSLASGTNSCSIPFEVASFFPFFARACRRGF